MRTILDSETFKKSVTANFFIKITCTFLGVISLTFMACLLIGMCMLNVPTSQFQDIIHIFFYSMLIFALICVCIHLFIVHNTLYPLKEIIKWASHSNQLKPIEIHPHSAKEVKEVFDIFNSMIERIKTEQENHLKAETLKSTSTLARQLSHDIRSPLAALNMIIRLELNTLPEETRILLRQQIDRIQDMANTLLQKGRIGQQNTTTQNGPELLSSLVEEIISEKRLNFREHLGLFISGDLYGHENYGLFSNINLCELKRILSNLINNAAEALPNLTGHINIELKPQDDHYLTITVSDNGKGIPKHIVSKLGQEELSYGKEGHRESGSGLALFHAKKMIESWGGNIKIESEEGSGTSIIITLQRTTPPKWFAPKLTLIPSQAIVILDDDHGIHQTWDNRFKELPLEQNSIEVIHLSTPHAFHDWVNINKNQYPTILYLTDFELLNFQETGLDLLEHHQITQASLVTSHYENEEILTRCEKLGITLIPKMMASLIPISVEKKLEYDCVYIDDDQLLRMIWKNVSQKKGINLLLLTETNEFYQYEHLCNKATTKIYLDSDLGIQKQRGEDFAVILHEKQYEHIFMVTGHDSSSFAQFPWLKVIGKNCPFL